MAISRGHDSARLILGVSGAIDSGAALVRDGQIVAAVNEERLSRRKFHTGMPWRSIAQVIRLAGASPGEIALCTYSDRIHSLCTDPDEESYDPPGLSKRLTAFLSQANLLEWLLGTPSGLRLYRGVFRCLLRPRLARLRRYLDSLGVQAPIRTTDHHAAHAAAAAFTSGWPECLAVSIDASGDGYCALVAERRGDDLRILHRTGCYHSLGVFYLYVTLMLGHKAGREGKITGLSAHGEPSRTIGVFRSYCNYDPAAGIIRNKRSGIACDYHDLAEDLRPFSREDIAAGIQRHFEECIVKFVRPHVRKTGLRRVALAGGVFANVRVNQCVREISEVDNVFVFPQMGDGGAAAGCALLHSQHQAAALERVYLGPCFTDEQIIRELRLRPALRFNKPDDIELEVARALAEGKTAARFSGPMEYGPRALGNRSILYRVTDPTVNDWLNKRLHRTEYMPFAPTIMEPHAGDYLEDWRPEHHTAWFMTITYRATPRCAREAPAVVHVDGTTRAQVLRREHNPAYYRILETYHELTGLPLILNTSFNMHEQPIVCTPRDALNAFEQSGLDLLAIGSYLVERP